MSFKVSSLGIDPSGRILVTLKKQSTDASTTLWISPGVPVESLTIGQIEQLARQEAAKEHAC